MDKGGSMAGGADGAAGAGGGERRRPGAAAGGERPDPSSAPAGGERESADGAPEAAPERPRRPAGYNPDRRQTLVERFRSARRDPSLVVIEGLHALRHALRFGAEPFEVLTSDPEGVERLARELAPDVADRIRSLARTIDQATLDQLTPAPIHTSIIALAPRPAQDIDAALADPRPAPVVVVEEPANTYNLGAIVRIAAAADAAALLATGKHDPWNPGSVRAGAGLQFALPVARVDGVPSCDRPLVALDPDGVVVDPGEIPPRSILVFGTERYGISEEIERRADMRVRIPMREGVSSLNVATAVAAVLYAMKWGAGGGWGRVR